MIRFKEAAKSYPLGKCKHTKYSRKMESPYRPIIVCSLCRVMDCDN